MTDQDSGRVFLGIYQSGANGTPQGRDRELDPCQGGMLGCQRATDSAQALVWATQQRDAGKRGVFNVTPVPIA